MSLHGNHVERSATAFGVAPDGQVRPGPGSATARPEAGAVQPVRLLLVVTRLDIGGVPNHVITVLTGLCRRGYRVTVACAECRDDHRATLQALGVRIEHLPLKRLLSPWTDLKALWGLVGLMKREGFDVVHTHMSKAALLGGLAGRLAGVPVVVNTAHNLGAIAMPKAWLRALFRVYDRALLGATTDAVITVTERVRDAVVAQRILPAARVHAIANGITAPAPSTPQARDAARQMLRQEIGVGADALVIGCVARLVWFKGLDALVDAMPGLVQSCPQLQVVVAGDGPLRAELQLRAVALGLAGHLHFLGERHDVPRLLEGFDLFVLPSVSEGMPLTILEAMHARLPVVATAVGGVPELVLHGETGLLVPARSPAALAAALQRLLLDGPLRQAMGEAGRQRQQLHFSADAMVLATDSVLRGLLRGARLRRTPPTAGDAKL